MEMNDGTLYQTEIISIRKGAAGQPGEMTGMIVYSDDRILGDITSNSIRGYSENAIRRHWHSERRKLCPLD